MDDRWFRLGDHGRYAAFQMADKLEILKRLEKSLSEYGLGAAYQPTIKFLLVLATESDRGMVLAGAAYIDNALAQLLQSYFVDEPVVQKLFSGNAPLSTFSSRIEIAFALGLIDSGIQRDINLIRKIRNECAHTDQYIKLTDERIKNRIRELSCFPAFKSLIRKFEKIDGDFEMLDDLDDDPKLTLLFDIGIILVYLSDSEQSATRKSKRQPFLDEWVNLAATELAKTK